MAQELFVYSQLELQRFADEVLTHARGLGANDVCVSVSESDTFSVDVRNADLESFEHRRSKRLHINLQVGKRSGSSYSSDLSSAALRHTVEAAIAIAKHTSEDEFAGLPDPAHMAKAPTDLSLLHPWQLSADEAIILACELEAAALKQSHRPENAFPDYTKGQLQSAGVTLSTRHGQFLFATSDGFSSGYATSHHSLWAKLIASSDREMQRGEWSSAARSACQLEPIERIGNKAADRALRRLDARSLKSRKCPVIFEAPVAPSLVGELLSALDGGAQYHRDSYLLDSLGRRILPEHIDVIEQPLMIGGIASAPFDDDGVATRDQPLVSNGVVRTYLLDSYSARQLKLKPAGHAGGPRNVQMRSQETRDSDDLPSLVRQMATGLLVTELLGGGVNPVTGDYSQGVAGFWVQDGVIQYPVEDITIAGNLVQMLDGILAIGADENPSSGLRVGSVLLDQMHVAGS